MNNSNEAQFMAKEISRYIAEKRDKKELALLKEKPSKGKGGINIRLFNLAKNLLGSSNEQIKNYKNRSNTSIDLKHQLERYEQLLFLLEDIEEPKEVISIKQEFDNFLSKNPENLDKNKLALLKNKPRKDKSGKEKGGLNLRLLRLVENKLGGGDYQVALLKNENKPKIDLEFQQSNYNFLTSILEEYLFDNRVLDITDEYKETLLTINQEHTVDIWLKQQAARARDIHFATHVGKLTHSSSRSSCINDISTRINPNYLTTNSLSEKIIDTATDNAKSTPAGELLSLEVNGKSLLDYIKNHDDSPFQPFTEDANEIEEWMMAFKQTYDSDKKQSHFLSKQIYFPLGQGKYHLLLPLVSSSLAHTLFLKLKGTFDEDNESVWTQRKNKKYHPDVAISYPNKAFLTLTRSLKAHLNVSKLNKERNGRFTLLTCKPPKWSQQQKSSSHINNLFNRSLSYQLRDEILTLQRLLLVIKAKQVAIKKPEMHRAIVKDINEIADRFFDELNMLNLLSNEAGWTKNTDLPLSQQILLEPARDDEVAIEERKKKQWQTEIAKDFAYWLNKQLKHKRLKLTLIQQRLWQDIFAEKLRHYIAAQEVIA